jgi:hypothetical protein
MYNIPEKTSYITNKNFTFASSLIMCKEEHKELLEALQKKKLELSRSPKKSRKFLVELGIVTPKGNLKKNYRHLCIPTEPV